MIAIGIRYRDRSDRSGHLVRKIVTRIILATGRDVRASPVLWP